MQKEPPPPQLPFSVHKKQVRKRMALVGAGGDGGRECFCVAYICVCETKVEQKKIWNINAIL